MFWSLFVRGGEAAASESSSLSSGSGGETSIVESALEGIVFKEGKGIFIKRFWKKRLLAYDEIAKCLRYYTPQRVLKGTIFLYDILFITPGRSSGRDARKDSVFEITIPGRVYVFHVNNIRETKKWIGIVSRELDSLKIRDRIQLNNGNINESTYSKTLRASSFLRNTLKIGDHREHEECCFLFDEEVQHKLIALESLCALQAMKIYELSHSVEKFSAKCAELEAPPSEEVLWLREENKKLRFSFKREQIRTLDLKAAKEEMEEKKIKDQDVQQLKKVEHHEDKHQPMKVEVRQVMQSPNKNSPSARKLVTDPSRTNLSKSATNLSTQIGDIARMEEIKKLTQELAETKAQLALARKHYLENPQPSPNFNSSPIVIDSTISTTTTTTTTTTTSQIASPNRSPNMAVRGPSKLVTNPESTAIANYKATSSYHTFTPPPSPGTFSIPPQLGTNPSQSNGFDLARPQLPIRAPPSPQTPTPLILSPPLILSESTPRTASPITILSEQLPNPILEISSNGQSSAHSIESFDSSKSVDSLESSSQETDRTASLSDFDLANNSKTMNGKHSHTVPPPTKSAIPLTVTSLTKSDSYNYPLIPPPTAQASPQFATVTTKPRSLSVESSSAPIFRNPRPGLNGLSPDALSNRSRTSSNPPPFKYSLSASAITTSTSSINEKFINSKLGSEFAQLLNNKEQETAITVQFIAKLNEALAEIANLTSMLDVEREKVKILMEEKNYMLETMEDMKAEKAKNQRFRDEMEDLMETTEGKLLAMREALEIEIQTRRAVEAKLEAQAVLHQSILEGDMPSIESSSYEHHYLLGNHS